MKDFSTPRTYILSAHRANHTPSENNAKHCELCAELALEGIPFRIAQGSFNGVFERSVIVLGVEHAQAVEILARSFNQESYLVVAEHDRHAYIVDTQSGYHTHVGKLENVGGEEDGEPEGDFTYVDGFYFTTDGSAGPDLPEGF